MSIRSALQNDNMRGASIMMGAGAFFLFNDTLVKSLAGEIPLFQLLLMRGVIVCALIGLWVAARGLPGARNISRRDWLLIAARAATEMAGAWFTLNALFVMVIANFTAILLSAPLFLTFIGAVFLREPVGLRRWLAVIAGFIGVLMIVRPGAADYNAGSIWAVGTVISVCCRDLVTRRLSPGVPSLMVTIVTASTITLMGAAGTLINGWVADGALARVGAAALFIIGGYLCSVMAVRVGEISFVSLFRYTSLIWALIIGFLVFGDIPHPMALAGAGLIALSGLYVFLLAGRATR